MPTYSYRCNACGFEFDRVQRMTEDAIKECPECHKDQATRQISGGNFILKGSGWYADLYSGSSNKKGGAVADTGASAKSEGSSSTSDSGSTSSTAASTSTPAAPSTATASTPSTAPAATK